jgi:hypothetical protein
MIAGAERRQSMNHTIDYIEQSIFSLRRAADDALRYQTWSAAGRAA